MNLSHINSIQKIENKSFETPWSHDSIIKEINNSSSINFICKNNKQIVGYSMGWMIKKEFQINNICIKRDFRKKKYGYFLLKHLLQVLATLKCKKVYLEVDEENYKAIRLYEKVGFIVSYIRKKYYNNGNDALVMHRDII